MSSAFEFDLSAGSTPVPAPAAPAPSAPIADLSYRGYDGPLLSRAARWWVVALAGIRTLRRKPWFWVLVAVSMIPYLVTGLQVYGRAQSPGAASMFGGGPQPRFAYYFFNTLQSQEFFIFLIALLIGSAAIASDNRANALQVYLARPITKADYLLGKWMGVFVPLYAVAMAPALILYVFCLLSVPHQFWSEDRLLILRLLAATAVPGAIHSSLMLGFSAWSRTSRMAGAIYAAVYFASGIIPQMVWAMQTHGDMSKHNILQNVSISGVITGLAQNTYHVVIHFQGFHRRRMEMQSFDIHPPNFWTMLAIGSALIIIGIAAARLKIRAVEVVRG